jgi:hypothetical protein
VAVRNLADLKLINGAGSGSLHIVSSDHQLTELAAGSGLYGPTLFDHYRGFTPTLAAYFVSPVVRKPSPRRAVVYSGGYIVSGPPGWSREPLPWVPRQLRLCERFDRLHLVQATGSSTTCPPLGVRGGTSGESADRRRMEELGRQCHQ